MGGCGHIARAWGARSKVVGVLSAQGCGRLALLQSWPYVQWLMDWQGPAQIWLRTTQRPYNMLVLAIRRNALAMASALLCSATATRATLGRTAITVIASAQSSNRAAIAKTQPIKSTVDGVQVTVTVSPSTFTKLWIARGSHAPHGTRTRAREI